MTRAEAIEELHYIKDSLVSCELSYDALDMAIESLSADVVEVVRCKDCIHHKHYRFSNEEGDICTVFEWKSKNDDFCSFAERSENEQIH